MALVVGHSQTKYLQKYFTDDRIIVMSFPGYSIRDLSQEQSFLDIVPDIPTVCIMIGANDIHRSDTSGIMEDLQSLCYKVRGLNPTVSVMVSGILPRGDNRFPGSKVSADFLRRFNSIADDVNYKLSCVSSYESWFTFVPQPDFTHDRRELLSRDGLHLYICRVVVDMNVFLHHLICLLLHKMQLKF